MLWTSVAIEKEGLYKHLTELRGMSPVEILPRIVTLYALSPDEKEISLYMITARVEHSRDKNKGSDH